MYYETEEAHRRALRAARLRGVRFLAEYAIAAADAYAVGVGPDGRVSFQGEAGSLHGLIELLDAQPSTEPDVAEEHHEWVAEVAYDGGTVRVELTEVDQ